jgi:hypothetical protein
MTRSPGWERLLQEYLDARRDTPFAWGTHDCCTFAAGAVEAMTGTDPMAHFRGQYRSAAGSVRALRTIGSGTLEATLDDLLGFSVPASLARRGDLVLSGGNLGVCIGPTALFVGQEGETEGLVRIDRAAWGAAKAWRI